MADNKNNSSNSVEDRRFTKNLRNLNGILDTLNISLYGTSKNDDELDELNSKFNRIMKDEVDGLTKKDRDDTTSFMNQLYSKDKKDNSIDDMLKKQFASLNIETEDNSIAEFITERYKNRLLRQNDIHEIASQLIELREAINVTRDAIVSADIITGKINRNIDFGSSIEDDDGENYISIIERMEEKFDLQEKIKNFIVSHGLEYGEYYVYCIPYSVIFNDFARNKDKYRTSKYGVQKMMYGESALDKNMETDDDDLDKFIESCYDDCKDFLIDNYIEEHNGINERSGTIISKTSNGSISNEEKLLKEPFVKDMKDILGRITICNEPLPLPILEEGFDSFDFFDENYMSEDGNYVLEAGKKKEKKLITDEDVYKRMLNGDDVSKDGTFFQNDKKEKNENFDDIKDCYMKMIEPTKIVPISIMDEEIGYFYLQEEDVTPLSGILSSTLYHRKFDDHRRENDIIGNIAGRIIQRFDKKFLKSNPKFKKMIVEAINYYNLNEKMIRFQFIPKEYLISFKINKDVEGHGTSMLEGSLFYAKLYLMLLLFKIMSIITNSNDTKVNYIRQSGIDKNVINKVQDIARQKQARKINIMDLFSYTTLINKVGNGVEMYVPVGKSGERPIETEILSGQDVQINNELMELLRNSYILGTGVPAAIMNYLNEADFAKSIEVANTKFNGRVVSYRLDFNGPITEMYRKIAKWSTNIPEDVIDKMKVTLPSAKSNINTTKSEMISNFTSIMDFVVNLYFGEKASDPKYSNHIAEFRKSLAMKYLSTLDFEELDKLFKDSEIKSVEKKLNPADDSDDEEF